MRIKRIAMICFRLIIAVAALALIGGAVTYIATSVQERNADRERQEAVRERQERDAGFRAEYAAKYDSTFTFNVRSYGATAEVKLKYKDDQTILYQLFFKADDELQIQLSNDRSVTLEFLDGDGFLLGSFVITKFTARAAGDPAQSRLVWGLSARGELPLDISRYVLVKEISVPHKVQFKPR